MTQYRLRLSNGRIIGPFNLNQVFELKMKGHIAGNEECQEYPLGEWRSLESFEFYSDLMDENKTAIIPEETDEKTFVLNIANIRNQLKEKEIDSMVEEAAPPVVEELTETIAMETDTPTQQMSETEILEPDSSSEETDEDSTEKTVVQSTKSLEDAGDKTLINPVAQQEIALMRKKLQEEEEARLAEERRKQEEEEKRKAEEELKALEAQDDSTQMIKLDNVKHELISIALEEEKKIEKELVKVIKERKKEEDDDEEDDEDESEEEELKKKKRKKIIIGVVALLFIYLFLNPKEDKPQKPPFKNLEPQISFPIPFDKADATRSQIEYDQARELYATGTYPSIVKAGLLLKSSYENNMGNKDALNLLVRAYAEQLENSAKKRIDAVTVFQLVQANRPILIQDPNGVIGLNLFYMAIEKKAAAADVIERYLKLNPKNVTQDLFAVYLETLLKLGRLDKAKTFYTALEKAPQKNRYSYQAIIEYLIVNQEFEKAEEYIDDAIKNFPGLTTFYFYKTDFLLKRKEFEEAKKYLQKVEDLNYEYNNIYLARFLARTGLLVAAQGDVQVATKFLQRSLAMENSTSLRMKLAELSLTGGAEKETDNLISESKAMKLLQTAKDHFEKRNYELALSTAARATDAYPGYIPAELFFAQTQLKLGLAEQALKTYERLVEKYPQHPQINFDLINAYIETYKFNLAKNRIAVISSTEMKEDYRYASLQAKLYNYMNDTLHALSWLKASLQMNPLNDKDIFMMAEILLRRANFDNARTMLNRCIELDPVNIDYRIAYARQIYETQDDRAAVGYLLDLLSEFGEHPKLLGEIAIMYYRAGKVKDFLAYKEKLQKLPVKDSSLYEFLIKAALLDERYDDIPGYAEELLRIEPGEIEAMMTAGRVLFENGKLVDAARWFARLQARLPSYPKVLFYIAKIKLMNSDFDGALEEIKKDIEANGENDSNLALMAEIYVNKGELIEAENLYKRAQKLNPRSYPALVGLADLSTKRANYDLALDLYKRASKLQNDQSILHKKIGDVYRLLGQGSLAIESYKLYLDIEPTAPDRKQIESYIRIME
ncbi:MAG: tetratricopeptide repeat protein [Candidatus Caldatribacteriota bacterium]